MTCSVCAFRCLVHLYVASEQQQMGESFKVGFTCPSSAKGFRKPLFTIFSQVVDWIFSWFIKILADEATLDNHFYLTQFCMRTQSINGCVCLLSSAGSELQDSAFGYFITACVVILLAILSYLTLPKMVKPHSSIYRLLLSITFSFSVKSPFWKALCALESGCFCDSQHLREPLLSSCLCSPVSVEVAHYGHCSPTGVLSVLHRE